jgi:hypothetical protein
LPRFKRRAMSAAMKAPCCARSAQLDACKRALLRNLRPGSAFGTLRPRRKRRHFLKQPSI